MQYKIQGFENLKKKMTVVIEISNNIIKISATVCTQKNQLTDHEQTNPWQYHKDQHTDASTSPNHIELSTITSDEKDNEPPITCYTYGQFMSLVNSISLST